MKTTINVKKEVEIKTLEVVASVSHWEDAEINGENTEDGRLVPFKVENMWCPIIDVDTGIIKDWPLGIKASIHFKVCDEGDYYLRDEQENRLFSIENDNVPKILCPKENGYGNYIIMDIDETGQILNWKPSFKEFNQIIN